ncbi:MAG: heavy metal transport/detoxification protein [Candidatus Peregrinibacteria bacterium GW2011_GWF2_33_10]|nr:MAG: heavy metal transport/detoxification protein [Candidatus Peregrinibacteria bacterium GW2011_GWF2_33_10]OGJ44178.1 MAG: hypothetical protein A2263_04345 [Candidatus Peregrinibacteria bacterium RIFOXYA2_FULL_33_21]OGJ44604.1 MAG: hypothetical protein A2272_00010 [Candidatus Peregrinibacteria bacterium RIFOXYA12_FULL_33_12]OGJ51807.1 MAG: hypothetical protein A2307_05010 [Candidatus Peregrinibacteria bacterium RIFOXYB2_FULL_33_20]
MQKTTIPIKGMHCKSCEILIEDSLKEISGVSKVFVSLKRKEAEIHSNRVLKSEEISHKVEEAGYEVGFDDKKHWFSRDLNEYKDLLKAFLVFLVLYFFVKTLGLTSISVGGGTPSSLPVVFLVGLTAGVSTCMALVGGLVLGISARHAEKHPEATALQNFRPHVFFNIGRIISYFLLGGLIGMIGKAFQLSGIVLGTLIIAVGLVMFLLGLQLTEISPRLSSFKFTLPSSISKALGIRKHHEKEYSHLNSMFVGALTFFLPCGFTQAMQLYAMTTGSFTQGALIMSIFALGTTPGLLGVGGLASVLKGQSAKKFFKFAGLVVLFLAVFNITNGYNLTGWGAFNFSQNNQIQNVNDENVSIENGVQIVKMEQGTFGYSPDEFIIKKGIPVKWIVNSENQYTCASSIYSQKLGISKTLIAGENVIEFTPDQTGQIPFSCSMGMYTGKFNVVE